MDTPTGGAGLPMLVAGAVAEVLSTIRRGTEVRERGAHDCTEALRPRSSPQRPPTAPPLLRPRRSSSRYKRQLRQGVLEPDPLIDQLNELRRTVFRDPDAIVLRPRECLTPFLEVVKSDAHGGVVTTVALRAVRRLLALGLIDSARCGLAEASATLELCVDDITWTRYVPGAPQTNAEVHVGIVEAFCECVTCDAGALLPPPRIAQLMRVCYRLGADGAGSEGGDLLRHVARGALTRIIITVFRRVAAEPDTSITPTPDPTPRGDEDGDGAKRDGDENSLGRDDKDKDPAASGPPAPRSDAFLEILQLVLELLPADTSDPDARERVLLVLDLLDAALGAAGPVLARRRDENPPYATCSLGRLTPVPPSAAHSTPPFNSPTPPPSASPRWNGSQEPSSTACWSLRRCQDTPFCPEYRA